MFRPLAPIALTIAASVSAAHEVQPQAMQDLELVNPTDFAVRNEGPNFIFYQCTTCAGTLNLSAFIHPTSDPIVSDAMAILTGAQSLTDANAACADAGCVIDLTRFDQMDVLTHWETLKEDGQPDLFRLTKFVRHENQIIEIYVAGTDQTRVDITSDSAVANLAPQITQAHE